MIATCPEELRGVLRKELDFIGIKKSEAGYMHVRFQVENEEQYYKCHLYLRSASRLLRSIKTVSAGESKYIFEKAKKINWPDIFDSRKTFIVEGIAAQRGEKKFGKNEISKSVRQAIQECFGFNKLEIPQVDLQEPDLKIVAHVSEGRCEISIDTSGKTMHKRGYRQEGHPAPLKETLAAGVLMKAGYYGQSVFYDPMCGSGTLAIEACMIALKKAPLIHRKKGEFGFEHLLDFNNSVWKDVCDRARRDKLDQPKFKVYASDIDQKYVSFARENALRARVEKHIDFFQHDFLTSIPEKLKDEKPGRIVVNLPYDERLGVGGGLEDFVKDSISKVKQDYKKWDVFLLVPEEVDHFLDDISFAKSSKLLNGAIEVRLLRL